MPSFLSTLPQYLLLFTYFCAFTTAQSCQGGTNTNPSCQLYYYDDASGTTEYYAPSDTDDFGIHESGSNCNGYAQAQLVGPGGTYDCGCLALDGSEQLVDCPGVQRGNSPEGVYSFQFTAGGVPTVGYFFNVYTITHTQYTSTAPTPTNVVTNTLYAISSTTVTTTATDTATSSQVTVTSPSSTATNTISITPRQSTTTITKTITFTSAAKVFTTTKVTKTVTSTMACGSAKPCATQQAKKKRDEPANPLAEIAERAYPPNVRLVRRGVNQGEGANGDGPLTTTVTPAPTVVTSTDVLTTTLTSTVTAPDVTTTVPANPPTSTYYTGVSTTRVTTTVPAQTRTKTAYSYTLLKTTITSTATITITSTTAVPCKR